MDLTEKQALEIYEPYREQIIETVSQVIMSSVDVRDELIVALPFPADFPCDMYMEDADGLFTYFIEAKYSMLRNKFTSLSVLGMDVPVPKDLQ